ncbi:hypothetical protein [Polycladidibacter hongkongensis]|uniref:hypothetical protein n=1 Tax=Polycladidibacter hongkongensis TaxID=1647556 RepID=UPI0008355AFA|nr:hypothetical protein [Pseudovibrio hongkongensis]
MFDRDKAYGEWLVFFFSTQKIVEAAPGVSINDDLLNLDREQKRLYTALIKLLVSTIDSETKAVYDALLASLKNPSNKLVEAKGSQIRFIVSSLDEKSANILSKQMTVYSMIGLAAIAHELQKADADLLGKIRSAIAGNSNFAEAYSIYAATYVGKSTDVTGISLSDKQQKLKELSDRTEKHLSELSKSAANDMKELRETTTKELIKQLEEKKDDCIRAIEQNANLNSAQKKWSDKEEAYKKSFWTSAAICIALFSLPLKLLFDHHANVIAYISSISTSLNGTQVPEIAGLVSVQLTNIFGKLAFITVPLFVYFWMLRLSVRFTFRSLLLMDDASQRLTFLKTYEHLVADGNVEANERTVLLNSLFAPMPGHGDARIDPPIPEFSTK